MLARLVRPIPLATPVAICALLGVNLAGDSFSPPLAEAASPTAPGIHVETWGKQRLASEAERTDEIRRLKSSGARWVRVIALWSSLETGGKGRWNEEAFALLDQQLARIRGAGLDVVLVAGPNTPFFASSDPLKYQHSAAGNGIWLDYRPENMEDYADFTRELARRARPRGVKTFQLWNEPDHSRGRWLPGPAAAEYADLLKAAYPAIKSANADATVLVGGLMNNNSAFLQGIYDAGGGPYFDGVASHLYPQFPPRICALASDGKPSPHALCGLWRLRETLRANGDPEKPIWLTELSWSSCRCHYREPVGERDQAIFLRQAYSLLAKRGDVPVALWFNLRDIAFPGVVRTDVGSGFGLLRPDGSGKRAMQSYRNYAHNSGATSTIVRPRKLRVGGSSPLRFTGRTERPRVLEAFAGPNALPCAPTAADQARRPGSRSLLRPRYVEAGEVSELLPLVPPRAEAERACGYLGANSVSVPDTSADTLLPLAIPPGKRCPSLVFDGSGSWAAGIVVETLDCERVRAVLSSWVSGGFEPASGPPGFTCTASKPDDDSRRAYACRGTGGEKLSFLTRPSEVYL